MHGFERLPNGVGCSHQLTCEFVVDEFVQIPQFAFKAIPPGDFPVVGCICPLDGRLMCCLDTLDLSLMLGNKAIEDLDYGPYADRGDCPDRAVLRESAG